MPSSKLGKPKTRVNTSTINKGSSTTSTRSEERVIFGGTSSTKMVQDSIKNSMRLFGVPHQFTAENDPRIGDATNLGRCFAERIIMEAPIIALKPGKPKFLPGMSDKEKKAFMGKVMNAIGGGGNIESEDEDTLIYYELEDCFNAMMAKVNILCKLMANFLGVSKTTVPWAKSGVTFGMYDWRYYTLKSQYGDVSYKKSKGNSVGAFIKDALSAFEESAMDDSTWLRFYVDSNASYSESNSNSTTTSIIESYTEKLEGIAKELDVISGIAGVDVQELAESSASSVDSFIQEHASGDGAIATMLSRISGATKQIISGGNFLIPEIWSQSEYSKNYSFSITLSTPYGCPEAWFLNIGVPLMHLLALSLPQQLSANTYKSPYLVKCYSPGWFNCNYGIIDSINIEKGADNSWSVGGLPNEVKVSLSVRDLYSTLSIPVKPYEKPATFMSSGMLEFLMVNCGCDITNQKMTDRLEVWKTVLANNIYDRITAKPWEIQQYFKDKIQGLFNIVQ